MRKYMVYMDDGQHAFRLAVPAKDEKTVREYVRGNGEVIHIKDVTSDYPISADKVTQALKDAGFGEVEIDYIVRALQEINICDIP